MRRPRWRFSAFISYSHAADGKLAPALQHGLHRFARPWYRMRAVDTFRDESDLSVTPELWPKIEAALAVAEFFILLASPEAARSRWVQREVAWWLENRSADRMLIVLTAGSLVWNERRAEFDASLTTALPPQLRGAFPHMPLWADLSWARENEELSLKHPEFVAAVAALAAPLHHRDKRQMMGEDVRQFRRTRRLGVALTVAVTALAMFLAVAVVALERETQRAQREAERAGREAERAGREAERAEQEADVARSRQYASDSIANLQTDPELSVLLGLEAVRVASTPNGESSLRAALTASHLRGVVRGHHPGIRTWQVGVDASDTLLAFLSDELLITGGADGFLRISTVPQGTEIAALGSTAGNVSGLAVTPEGRWAVAGYGDGTARIWDLSANRLLRVLSGHADRILHVEVAADGTRAVTASSDGTARVWELENDTSPLVLHGHEGAVNMASFSSDGSRLVSAGQDHTVRVWDANTGRELRRLIGHTFDVTWADFSPDDSLIATASRDLTARLWDSRTGEELQTLSPSGVPIGEMNSITFNADGTRLVTGSTVAVTIWDVASGNQIAVYRGHPLSVWSAAFGRIENEILTAGEDGTARIWNFQTDETLAVFRGHTARVSSAAFSPNGRWVATGSADGTARIWEVIGNPFAGYRHDGLRGGFVSSTGKLALVEQSSDVWSFEDPENAGHILGSLSFPEGPPARAAWDAQDQMLATSSQRGIAHVRAVPSGEELAQLEMSSTHPLQFEFSPDGRWLVTAAFEGGFAIWHVGTWSRVADSEPYGASGKYPTFSPDGVWFAFVVTSPDANGADASQLHVVQTGDWTEKAVLDVSFRETLSDLAFSPAGDVIAAANQDLVRQWQVGTWRELSSLEGHSERVLDLAFSPDGRLIATSGEDRSARVWEVATADVLSELRGHRGPVWSVTFSADGTNVLTGSDDGSARVWDAASGTGLATLPGQRGAIYSATYSQDGRRIITESGWGDVIIHPASLADLIRVAGQRITRYLTCEEQRAYLNPDTSC